MKRASKIAIRVFSITLFAGLVFITGLLNKSGTKDQDKKEPNDKNEGLFSAFDVPHALADFPTNGDSVFVCSGDTSDGSGNT